MTHFAERLREVRRLTGLSQESFGALAGVSRTAQFSYEGGKTAPDADYLEALALHGVDVVYLLAGRRSNTLATAEDTAMLDQFHACGADERAILFETAKRFAIAGRIANGSAKPEKSA